MNVFIDTNVLIYAVDVGEPKKHAAARAWRNWLWDTGRGRLSFQVLQEFYVKVTQKVPNSRIKARDEVLDLMAWRPVAIDAQLVTRAWAIQDRYGFSFWDSSIVAAAQTAGCRYLLTEDLQHQQRIDTLEIINPFLRQPQLLSTE